MVQEIAFDGEKYQTESALLLDWSVSVGAVIERGETLCTLETSEGSFEISSQVDGKILQLFYAPGDEIQSGTALALVGEPGEALTDDLSTPGVSVDPEEMLSEEMAGRRSVGTPGADIDLFVIGGGPAGYRAALRASRHGARVVLAEENLLGGTCLNFGCVPAKTLIHIARIYRGAADSAAMGIEAGRLTYNHTKALDWKNRSVERLRRGIEGQLKRAGVQVVHAGARFLGPGKVSAGGTEYHTRYVLIANGAQAAPFDVDISGASIPVLGSTAAFDLTEVPDRMLVLGGGYIGLEIAGLFSALGTSVTVMESEPDVLAFAGSDIGRQMRLAMDTTRFIVNAKARRVSGNTVYYEDERGEQSLQTDSVVQVVGRRPRLGPIGEYGIDLNESGITVDERMRTNIEGVYAAGDVTGKLMLAHAAYRMADVAVNNMFGDGTDTVNMNAMPWVVYTMPELAGCGRNQAQAEAEGIEVEVNLLPLASNNRYLAEHADARGWCRLVSEVESGRLIGAFMMGHGVSELIAQAAMAVETNMSVHEISRVVAPHPTISEAFRDAADSASHISKVMAADHLSNPHL